MWLGLGIMMNAKAFWVFCWYFVGLGFGPTTIILKYSDRVIGFFKHPFAAFITPDSLVDSTDEAVRQRWGSFPWSSCCSQRELRWKEAGHGTSLAEFMPTLFLDPNYLWLDARVRSQSGKLQGQYERHGSTPLILVLALE